MREYHVMMLRPVTYPGGRVHHDPERQSTFATGRPLDSATPGRRHRASVLFGFVVIVLVAVLVL